MVFRGNAPENPEARSAGDFMPISLEIETGFPNHGFRHPLSALTDKSIGNCFALIDESIAAGFPAAPSQVSEGLGNYERLSRPSHTTLVTSCSAFAMSSSSSGS